MRTKEICGIHTAHVESGVDEEEVVADDEVREDGRGDADVSEAEVEHRHMHLVGPAAAALLINLGAQPLSMTLCLDSFQ